MEEGPKAKELEEVDSLNEETLDADNLTQGLEEVSGGVCMSFCATMN